ncbi:MAG: phage Gp19/Gp15/Gp42 family protein [Clostridia bacterium]|nr:phage Gp19/Gp15/Gp42 family protein [Clostridia bacterium]
MQYASLSDVNTLWRHLTQEESERAAELLEVISSSLRVEARKVGKDLDAMIAEDEDLAEVAKSVTVDVVARTLMTSTNREPMTQFSESGMGYSASGSFLIPGGGLFIKKSELARLGLKRQRIGVMEIYGIPERD